MGANSGIYKLLLLFHILAAIAGFGPTLVAPLYGAEARARRGREGLAIAEATFKVAGTFATWVIYTVPVFGILLILVSDDAWKFSQAWISFSFLLYLAGIGILHAVHLPNLRRMNQLMAELAAGAGPGSGAGAAVGQAGPPPQVAELERRGQRAAAFGGLLNVLLVLILALMIWKPGV